MTSIRGLFLQTLGDKLGFNRKAAATNYRTGKPWEAASRGWQALFHAVCNRLVQKIEASSLGQFAHNDYTLTVLLNDLAQEIDRPFTPEGQARLKERQRTNPPPKGPMLNVEARQNQPY